MPWALRIFIIFSTEKRREQKFFNLFVLYNTIVDSNNKTKKRGNEMKFETFKRNYKAAYLLCGDKVDMAFITPVTISILEELATNGYCRTCKCKGHGRFSKNDDRTAVIESLLAEGKTDYVKINDAPRGSDTGNVIILAGKDSLGSCWSETIASDGEYMLHYAGAYIVTEPTKEKYIPTAIVDKIKDMIDRYDCYNYKKSI